MDIHFAAKQLNGNQYGSEGSPVLFEAMKAVGLVAVFGYSDDNVELRGAIDDEIGAYEGTTFHVTSDGLLTNDCDNDDCPHFEKLKAKAPAIEAVWYADEDSPPWTFRTSIPYATFEIEEDSETYCRGIVFSLASLTNPDIRDSSE